MSSIPSVRSAATAPFQQIVTLDWLPEPEIIPDQTGAKSDQSGSDLPNQPTGQQATGQPSTAPVYRVDNRHDRFELGKDERTPHLHVSIKSRPINKTVSIDELVEQKRRQQKIQDAGIQQLVVSAFTPLEVPNANLPDFDSPVQDSRVQDSRVSDSRASGVEAANMNRESGKATASGSITKQTVSFESHDSTNVAIAGSTTVSIQSDGWQVGGKREPELQVNSKSEDAHSIVVPLLKPAWEVREFRWPKTVSFLIEHHRAAFDRLVDSLQLGPQPTGARIGVVHPCAGQGASTLATCLANVLADGNRQVALIDFDLDNPCLESLAKIKLQAGWQELIRQAEPVEEYLVRSAEQNLTLMPLRREESLVENRPVLLKTLKEVADLMKSHFDYSVFDIGGPQNLLIEENCHVGFLDAAVIVSDSCNSGSVAVRIYQQLLAAGVPSVVVAENFRSSAKSVA